MTPSESAWYAAMSRLTGYTAREHWGTHYPAQGDVSTERALEITKRCHALGLNKDKVYEEMKNEPRVLYAAGFRTPDGKMHYFDGPNPSLQSLRSATPPKQELHEKGARAYLVRLEGNTVTPVARWDEENQEWQRKKEQPSE